MVKISKDIIGSVFLIAVSIVIFAATFNMQKLTVSKIGAEFMPRLVAIAIFSLSVILLIKAIRQTKQSKQMDIEVEQDEEEVKESGNKSISPKGVLLTVVLMGLYISLLKPIGFLIMTAVYLFFQMYVLADKSEQRIPLFLGISIVSSIAVYYCFKSVFHLMLPAGILG